MTKDEKYNIYRPNAKAGDIVLFHGHAIISRLIQHFDDAYYNHTAIVTEANDRILCIDANGDGVQIHFLSQEVESENDFDILRPLRTADQIATALKNILNKAEIGINYDFWALGRIAINKKTIFRIPYCSNKRFYCSEYGRLYTDYLGINCYDNKTDVSPQDFVRLYDPTQLQKITDFKQDK
jgi:hypothetical protein